MVKLNFGEKNQISFQDENEFYTVLGICCNKQVLSISYEPNKKTGSYADAYRIRKLSKTKTLPNVLQKAITTGNRINCNGYVQYLIKEFNFFQKGSKIYGILENVIQKIPSEFIGNFMAGYKNYSLKQQETSIVTFETEKISKNISNIKEVPIPKTIKKCTASSKNGALKRVKTDYITKQINDKIIGQLGEKLVYNYECEKIKKLSQKDSAFKKLKPLWVSLENDNMGYDILSYNEKKEKIFIEVKTTTSNKYADFYISKQEIEFSKENFNNYYLYRVFGLSNKKDTANFYILKGDVSKSTEIVLQETNYVAKIK